MSRRARGAHKRRRDAERELETALRAFLTSDEPGGEARLRGMRMIATYAGVPRERVQEIFDAVKAEVAS